MRSRALLIDDPIFLEHRAKTEHPERPERLIAARAAIEQARSVVEFEDLEARDATPEELLRVHTRDHLELLGQAAGHWGLLDADTFVCPRSVNAALRAAGASVVLVNELLKANADFGVALLRPPGHHARPSNAMGFCLINNAAVAAAEARARGVDRVVVLDWDVHHGNGTQEMFYERADVLYVSLHQFPYYPGTGASDEVGGGAGRGHTVNVPLSAGASDAAYAAAFDRIICPILERYHPGLVLVSAGFDAHVRDPLGGMALSDAGYAMLARKLQNALAVDAKIALLLEGGYDLAGLQGSLGACLSALAGAAPLAENQGALAPIHEKELDRAFETQRGHWQLG